MPDKRIDEKFVNHAWEQMLATLDRELPTEEKPRRRIVFVPWQWAAAASVLLLLTIGLGWWSYQQQTTAPIADASPAVSTPNNITTSEEDCDETNPAPVLVQKEPQPSKGKIETSAQTAVIGAKKERNQTKQVPAEMARMAIVQTTSDAEKDLSVSNATLPKESATTAFPAEETAPKLQAPSLQSLNARQIALLENEKLSAADYKKSMPLSMPERDEKFADSKWKIGLELATYASPDAALDGYAGGAIVEVPTQSEKFNLRTGLNFNAQQRYFDSDVPVPEADRNTGFGTAVVVDPSPDLQINAQQLSLPLTVEFKPRKAWGLEGGLQASYLLGARNLEGAEAYQTMVGLANGNDAISTFVESLSVKSQQNTGNAFYDQSVDNSKVNIEAFRRFDVAVLAGFGVYPTKNIGVRLQYQRGLIDLLKADQFKTFGNNVRLSAVYFFGK